MKVGFVSFLLMLSVSRVAGVAANGGCPPGSRRVILNFDKVPDGKRTIPGEMVSDQWKDIGIMFSGKRRLYKKRKPLEDSPALRLFDSAHPTGGDFDLGSPNEGCDICEDPTVSCPGVATHNPRIAAATNCHNQRSILIIDSGKRKPNDFRKGGEIVISFTVPVPKVLSIGVMDVTKMHNVPSSTISLFDSQEKLLFEKPIDPLGDNTWQQERIQHSGDISTMKLDVYGSFGLTHLKFCTPLPEIDPPTIAPTYSWSFSPETPASLGVDVPAMIPTDAPTISEPSPTDRPTVPTPDEPDITPTAPPTVEVPDTDPPTVTPTAPPTDPPTVSETDPPIPLPTDPPTVSTPDEPDITPTAPPAVKIPETDPPTASPTDPSTGSPTAAPTVNIPETDPPTASPTDPPTESPTDPPSVDIPDTDPPTVSPTDSPTVPDTDAPTVAKTATPTASPTDAPTVSPTVPPVSDPPEDKPNPTNGGSSGGAKPDDLPMNCEIMRENTLIVRWRVNGNSLDVELTGYMTETDYMSFGVSGADNATVMIGSDAVIAYLSSDGAPVVEDYTLSAKIGCENGFGVCSDESLKLSNDVTKVGGGRSGDVTVVSYTRPLGAMDAEDKAIPVEAGELTYVSWALGPMSSEGVPLFHSLAYPDFEEHFFLDFGRDPVDNCDSGRGR